MIWQNKTDYCVLFKCKCYEINFQTLQEASQLLQVTTRSTQNEMVNLYKISHARRTVYQSVPTSGTEKDTDRYTCIRQEAACLLDKLTLTKVLTDFDVLRLIISDPITVDG